MCARDAPPIIHAGGMAELLPEHAAPTRAYRVEAPGRGHEGSLVAQALARNEHRHGPVLAVAVPQLPAFPPAHALRARAALNTSQPGVTCAGIHGAARGAHVAGDGRRAAHQPHVQRCPSSVMAPMCAVPFAAIPRRGLPADFSRQP